jgi:hypothetical protein
VNGNAGLAGFAVDNIRIDEFTFEDDGTYINDINGLDASERQDVTVATHDFTSGIYRIDTTTLFNSTIEGTSWYNKTEITTANNHTQIIFSIASADITLMQPNVLDCVSDITYKCVYTYDSVSQHSFTVPLLNGVIAGEYEVRQSTNNRPIMGRSILNLMLETSLIGQRLTMDGMTVTNTTSASMRY